MAPTCRLDLYTGIDFGGDKIEHSEDEIDETTTYKDVSIASYENPNPDDCCWRIHE